MTTDNPILSKIRKLLALADSARNSSEAEAQAAALKVQEMLQDYGLSLAEVEAAGGRSDDGGRAAVTADRRALYRWQRQLMATLADNNFCMHNVHEVVDGRRKSKRDELVGRALNIDVTLATYDYIAVAVKRAANDSGFAHAGSERDHHTFLDGAVGRVVERLNDRRREREAQEAAAKAEQAAKGGQVNALVLTDVYGSERDLNNDVLNGFPAGTTAARRRERADKEARRAQLEKELIAQGVERIEAFYLSHGYDADRSKAYAMQYRQKVRASSRPSRGWSKGWTKADEAAERRTNSPAYRAGRAAGSAIGLDTQVGGGNAARRIK